MAKVTLRVIDGADRGRVYDDLEPPVTVGREEGNSIQLNDERVSRFHLKIQDDHERLVLTDLESTNGTRVNGEDIQLRILRHGDVITVGRSVMQVGTREQIASRLARLREGGRESERSIEPVEGEEAAADASLDIELNFGDDSDLQATLHTLEPPDLPERMSPGQAAQLSELLEYLHIRIRRLLGTVKPGEKSGGVMLDPHQWQNLVDLQARLAEYLRRIGDPDYSR